MSNNREKRVYQDKIHLFLALQRVPNKGSKQCFRTIIKDEELDLKIVEAKCKIFGGEWRIHTTVNHRDPEKARKWLIKHLVDNPENASILDSVWKTALLQRECRGNNFFMLDIDTQDSEKIKIVDDILGKVVVCDKIKSPKGWHYITIPFDTREVCELEYVTFLRDGYYYVKTVRSE
jgi:hypothetical protein